MNSKFQYNVQKRNYNEMIDNSIKSQTNYDSFLKRQLFKSALKFGGPINQTIKIHHTENARKSMGTNLHKNNIGFDINEFEKTQNKIINNNNTNININRKKSCIESKLPSNFSKILSIFCIFSLYFFKK